MPRRIDHEGKVYHEDEARSCWTKIRRRWQEITAATLFAVGLALLFASVFSTDSECTSSRLSASVLVTVPNPHGANDSAGHAVDHDH